MYVLTSIHVFLGLRWANDDQIYVSHNGTDDNNCGPSHSKSCKTIKYALKNFNQNQSIIILDGGSVEQMKYSIREPIEITANIIYVHPIC